MAVHLILKKILMQTLDLFFSFCEPASQISWTSDTKDNVLVLPVNQIACLLVNNAMCYIPPSPPQKPAMAREFKWPGSRLLQRKAITCIYRTSCYLSPTLFHFAICATKYPLERCFTKGKCSIYIPVRSGHNADHR